MSTNLCLEDNFILERPECWEQIIKLKDAIDDLRHETVDKLRKDLTKALGAAGYEHELNWGAQMDPYNDNLAIQISNPKLTDLFPTFENGVIIEYNFASDSLRLALYINEALSTRLSPSCLTRLKDASQKLGQDDRWHYMQELIPKGLFLNNSHRVVELQQQSKRFEFIKILMLQIENYCKDLIGNLREKQ